MMLGSCAQHQSKTEHQNEKTTNSKVNFNSGLKIENRINRGTNYTDPQGIDYSIRNIPITITNDSTIPIHLQIAFSTEYNYPIPESKEHFKLIPLPKEWALDGWGVTESMLDELPKLIEKPSLTVKLEAGEELLLSIGSLYSRPTKTSGVLPRTLFVQNDGKSFPECESLMQEELSSNQQIPMGLKIIIGERCMLIPCGSIAYLKN